jgi:hypothetical protein
MLQDLVWFEMTAPRKGVVGDLLPKQETCEGI